MINQQEDTITNPRWKCLTNSELIELLSLEKKRNKDLEEKLSVSEKLYNKIHFQYKKLLIFFFGKSSEKFERLFSEQNDEEFFEEGSIIDSSKNCNLDNTQEAQEPKPSDSLNEISASEDNPENAMASENNNYSADNQKNAIPDDTKDSTSSSKKNNSREVTASASNAGGNNSSEKSNKNNQGDGKENKESKRIRDLNEKFPDLETIEKEIDFASNPTCSNCNEQMCFSGLYETSKELFYIRSKVLILLKKRKKWKCSKNGCSLVTAPLPPKIAPGSCLSDSLVIQCALSKFQYLMPSNRIATQFSHQLLKLFPPQLVLSGQHAFADFFLPVYQLIKSEIQENFLIYADETPHRMLEGPNSDKTWFLWSFSSDKQTLFEIENTRSGEVAADFLAASNCNYLMSDVYSGYTRAIREANVIRKSLNKSEILPLYCNAHARRKFVEAAQVNEDEAAIFLAVYKKIYFLESLVKKLPSKEDKRLKRIKMRALFEKILHLGKQMQQSYSSSGPLVKAINYFTQNYEGLTRFIDNPDLPIDNNLSERQLRSPVVGRKTWYGTHSQRGADTNQIIFTIFQSCSLANINPIHYVEAVVKALHKGDPPFTPQTYAELISNAENQFA